MIPEKLYCLILVPDCASSFPDGNTTFLLPGTTWSLATNMAMPVTTEVVLVWLTHAGVQMYSRLSQLPQFQQYPLQVSMRTESLNVRFVPVSEITTGVTNGVMAEGVQITFVNCDTVVNSHLDAEINSPPDERDFLGSGYQFSTTLYSTSQPATESLPQELFTYLKAHFGGCGCLCEVHSLDPDFAGAAIGFRWT